MASRLFPFLTWLPTYRRRDLPGDLIAGLTTAVMLIPQAMAYAMLAGLPPIVGLYASTLPLIVYALFGTSRQLAVGPVAMVSLLVASGVGALAPQGSPEYIGLAVLLALMVGVLQVGMGVFRVGFLVNFLAHPVVAGFSSAAALIIGLSQLKHLLGIDLARSSHVHETILAAAERIGEVHVPTLVLGLAAIAILIGLKRISPKIPGALVVVVLGALAVLGLGLDTQGVKIVGTVPAGLPPLSLPSLDWQNVQGLLPTALAIGFVGFMESISVARAFARRNRYEVEANQELVGLGMANLAAGVVSGYPVTGGFSRTAVNAHAGSKTGLASIVSAVIVVATLLFLTPLFYYLPKAVLASIIMVAVFGLIDIKEAKHLAHVHRGDLGLLVLTFIATLALGIEEGIVLGIVASLLVFVVRTTQPHTAVLGRLPGTEVYRNVERFPEAVKVPGVVIVRVDASFYFGNVTFLKQMLQRTIADSQGPVHAVIIDATSINRLDSSADAALQEIHEAFSQREIRLLISGVKGPVRDMMARSGLAAKLGADGKHLTVQSAVEASVEVITP